MVVKCTTGPLSHVPPGEEALCVCVCVLMSWHGEVCTVVVAEGTVVEEMVVWWLWYRGQE